MILSYRRYRVPKPRLRFPPERSRALTARRKEVEASSSEIGRFLQSNMRSASSKPLLSVCAKTVEERRKGENVGAFGKQTCVDVGEQPRVDKETFAAESREVPRKKFLRGGERCQTVVRVESAALRHVNVEHLVAEFEWP